MSLKMSSSFFINFVKLSLRELVLEGSNDAVVSGLVVSIDLVGDEDLLEPGSKVVLAHYQHTLVEMVHHQIIHLHRSLYVRPTTATTATEERKEGKKNNKC